MQNMCKLKAPVMAHGAPVDLLTATFSSIWHNNLAQTHANQASTMKTMSRRISTTNLSTIALCLLFIIFCVTNSQANPWAGERKPTKPALIVYPTSPVNFVPAHTGFVLTCKGEHDHPSAFERLEWYGPKDKVQTNSVTSHQGSAKLTFVNPTVEDSGNYTCRAIYHGNDQMEATVNVNFYIDIKMDCFEHQAIILNRTGQKFYCLISAQPPPTIEWWKDGQLITQDANDRYKYDQEGYMNIVGPVSELDAGRYTIRASVLATGKLQERDIHITINTEPVLLQKEQQSSAIDGEFKELTCSVEGKPQPMIHWIDPHKRNLSVEGGYVVDPLKGTLKIERVRKDRDEGNFECVAVNPVGQARAMINQIVVQRPVITAFENQTIDEGSSVTLECRSTGYPTPNITIRRENHPIFQKGDYIFQEQDLAMDAGNHVYRLKLGPLNRTHDSNYFCSSDNSAGKAERIGRIKIKHSPDLQTTPKRQVYLNSQVAQLTCVVQGYPEPTITWWRDGSQLTSNEYTFSKGVDGSTNILTMKVNPSNMRGVLGDYLCVATNDMGEEKITIRLEEARRPGPITSARVVSTTPTTALLQIDPPFDDGGLRLINYHISYSGAMRYDAPHTPEYMRGLSEHSAGNTTLSYNGAKTVHVLRDLLPSYRYNLNIRAENLLGLSLDQSFPLVVETMEPKAPDRPTLTSPSGLLQQGQQVSSPFADGYKLAWSEPQLNNGNPITNYRIKYYEVRAQDNNWARVSDAALEFSHNSNRDLKMYINTMKPGKSYKIEVRAENKRGLSEPSELIVTTPLNGSSISDLNGVAVSAWLSEFAPPNYIVILIFFAVIIVFAITDLTCFFRHEVGLIYFIKNSCCVSKPKSMIPEHS